MSGIASISANRAVAHALPRRFREKSLLRSKTYCARSFSASRLGSSRAAGFRGRGAAGFRARGAAGFMAQSAAVFMARGADAFMARGADFMARGASNVRGALRGQVPVHV